MPSNDPTGTGYVGTTEAARRFGLNPNTILRMCGRGDLAGAVRVGKKWRIPRETLDRLAAGEPAAGGE